jgi:hypothetical protein
MVIHRLCGKDWNRKTLADTIFNAGEKFYIHREHEQANGQKQSALKQWKYRACNAQSNKKSNTDGDAYHALHACSAALAQSMQNKILGSN